jgi:hypothetical protein
MRWIIVRWGFALLLLAASAHLMRQGFKLAGIGAAGHVIFSLAAFVTSILLVTPETALRLAGWFGSLFADLFFPSETFKKPPLSYHMARHYRKCRRLDESLAHYESIIQNYPTERDAYLELLEVAQTLGDSRRTARITARFERQFGHPPPSEIP